MLRGIGRTVAALFRASRFEQEMREELRVHIDHRADDLVRSGMARDVAVRQARLEFGGVEACKEECRDARGFLVMRITNGAWMDLRLAARRLRATPLFLLFAALSLSLGAAVTTTAYSVLESLLWRSPGIAGASRVALVTAPTSSGLHQWRAIMSRPDFDDLRAAQHSFGGLAASAPFAQGLVGPEISEIVEGEAVTGNYFQTLGVTAAVGRTIQALDDERPTAVVVLSHRVWRTRFEADPAIVGRVVRLAGHPFQIVGVAPQSFEGLTPLPGISTSAWVPLGATSLFSSGTSSKPATRERRELSIVGRLAPDAVPGSAAAEIATLARRFDAAFPISNLRAEEGQRTVTRQWSTRLVTAMDYGAPISLGMLVLGLVALVLVVACTNLANLMLARGTVRHHEFAVRRALGASRWRLVREQLAESAIIAALGGAGALVLTRVLFVLSTVDVPIPRGSFHLEPRLSVSALVVAAGALLLSIVVFGVEPALQLTQERVSADLAAEAGTASAPRARRHRTLLRWQVAISACFFLIAAVLARGVIAEARHDSGIALDQLAVVTVHPRMQGWDEGRARRVLDSALDAARQNHAIRAVAASSGVPFGMNMTSWAHVTTPDKPFVGGQQRDYASVIAATPEIFSTLGVPILRGRAFDYRDHATAPRVMVTSERTARAMLGTPDPIGRQVMLQMWGRPPVETFTIVGVARDTDTERLTWRTGDLMYIPLAQHYEPSLAIVARAAGDPAAAVRVLQAALRRADPDLGTGTAGTGTQLFSGAFLAARIAGVLAVTLGMLTLILAMVGLYGIQSHIVAWRTHELGVRVALGASARQIERMVLAEGARPVVEGMVLGLLLGAIARLVVRAIVAAPIQVIDPIAFAAVPVPLFIAALVACYLPARRAARVDPNVALRHL